METRITSRNKQEYAGVARGVRREFAVDVSDSGVRDGGDGRTSRRAGGLQAGTHTRQHTR